MSKSGIIVIKIGTSTLTLDNKLDLQNLQRIVKEIALSKKKAIIVTSGAIVTGAQKLGLASKPKTIPEKQAAAAIGQSVLMRQYEKAFEKFGITTAQVLLTRDALTDKERYRNVRNTLTTLLNEGVVPIVNENDTVSTEEIKVGDNDTLSALVSELISADILVLLTDVDGFYIKDKKVDVIKKITKEIRFAAGHSLTEIGTGGMITKINAAQICMSSGISVFIANGRERGAINSIISGKKIGTKFCPKKYR
ncbi:glutamate 5-kinase [candidate division WOR-1 bacterium RIFOXYC2_FULL_37_10]|uniref:Glutamate 5-kinase n=1 Tax=candidate division WOR-1 bacterium RIFOXYB2_FULL_37_13 TaxID=1802579 RepID=A0A1F4SU69_UNCSA|nr:MAG: glutamate 5-kinase [candidate division WOR-1 bacterium RIFOXYB2_FULL_37_13]OGC33935.1 MAG: glutamate 5-kinase [candidate division WOR-1 bacterium RIFOXYC2_FULL_37_10]